MWHRKDPNNEATPLLPALGKRHGDTFNVNYSDILISNPILLAERRESSVCNYYYHPLRLFFAPHRHTTAAEMQSRHTPRRSNNNLPLPCLVHTTFLSGLTSIITQLLHHKKKMTELKRTKKRWARRKWASPLPHSRTTHLRTASEQANTILCRLRFVDFLSLPLILCSVHKMVPHPPGPVCEYQIHVW